MDYRDHILYKDNYGEDELKYLNLLAQKFPTIQAVCTEIINLEAILNLPKGTGHFLTDILAEHAPCKSDDLDDVPTYERNEGICLVSTLFCRAKRKSKWFRWEVS